MTQSIFAETAWGTAEQTPAGCNTVSVQTWASPWVGTEPERILPTQFTARADAPGAADPIEETIAFMLSRYGDALRRLAD